MKLPELRRVVASKEEMCFQIASRHSDNECARTFALKVPFLAPSGHEPSC